MQSPKDLNALFAALREAKILVGPREVLRIQEILARAEELDADGLRSILAAVVAKSREEKQKFDEIFRLFLQSQDASPTTKKITASLELGESKPGPDVEPDKPKPPIPPPKPRSSWRPFSIIAGVMAAALGISFVVAKYTQSVDPPLGVAASASASSAATATPTNSTGDAGNTKNSTFVPVAATSPKISASGITTAIAVTNPEVVPDARTFPTYVPRLDVESQSFLTSSSGIITGLGILVIAVGAIVARWRMRLKILPPRAPAPTRAGSRELALSSPVPRDLELLDMQSEDALVWGIGRFVTEEFTTTLDIEESIAATVAAGGRPELRFERRGRHRQVCLWIDESSKDPAIERFGREISLALSRVGLEVEVSRFWAVPDKLVRQDGTSFTAASLEEELAFSIVAILTDGHALTTRHAGADRRFGISRLLRMFSRLPRLAFVDFGEGPSRASRVARAYGITSVRPDEAAAFLALGRKPETRDVLTHKLTGDATAWAAACALGMRPVDEETAYDVRRSLGLSVSPWSWSVVRRSGKAAGDWVEWSQPKRAELLDWLRRAEHGAENVAVDPQSILGKTIAYWIQRLEAEARARKENDSQKPWTGTPAERTMRIELAFLDLWDQPESVAKTLYSFVGTDAEELVREKLGDYGPLEVEGTPGVIVLPWRFDGLSDATKAMFERLGFGPDATGRQDKLAADLVERRGRLWMGLGLAFGLGIAVFASGIRAWQQADFRCVIENVEGCGGWCGQVESWNADGSRLVAGGLVGFSVQKNAGRTDLPTLRFELKQVNCEAMTAEGWFVQRCGQKVPPEKPERPGEPRRKVFVLQGNPSDERVRSFGKGLLDRGAADVVLIRPEIPGIGGLNEWLPLLDLERDHVVLMRLQDEEVKPQSDSTEVKIRRYFAQLPKKSRLWTLPDKPKQIWWDNANNAITFDSGGQVLGVDDQGRVQNTSILPPQLLPIKWLVVDPSDAALVIEGSDGKMHLVTATSASHELSTRGGNLVGPVVWSPNGQRFAGITTTGAVLYWDLSNREPHEFPTEQSLAPKAVVWSLGGNEVFVGSPQGVTLIADGQDPILMSTTNQSISSMIGPVAGKYIFISEKTGLAQIVGSDNALQGSPGLRPIREVRAMTGAISPDGNNIATVHEGGKIRIATIDNDITIDEFACDTTIAPAWSRDGTRLLVACGKSVYDRYVFSPMFGIKDVNAACISRENLEKDFGARISEAALMYSHCAPGADL